MTMNRREWMRSCGGAIAASVLAPIASCGSAGEPYEFRAGPEDAGLTVWEATARRYSVGVDVPKNGWGNPALRGLRKVVIVNGDFSEHWVFEVNGGERFGSRESAEATRVREGDIITWYTVSL